MKPNFNFHCIVLLQLLYLCAACEELYNTEMVPPEGAIVFDGVITNEPPPYFFSLSKPSGGLGEYVSRGYERINDAEIVIIGMNCILNIKERNILHVNGWCLKLLLTK